MQRALCTVRLPVRARARARTLKTVSVETPVHEFPAEWRAVCVRASCTKYDNHYRYRHSDGKGKTGGVRQDAIFVLARATRFGRGDTSRALSFSLDAKIFTFVGKNLTEIQDICKKKKTKTRTYTRGVVRLN